MSLTKTSDVNSAVRYEYSAVQYNNFTGNKDDPVSFKRKTKERLLKNFDVLLTVHLSIILVINQLNAQILIV